MLELDEPFRDEEHFIFFPSNLAIQVWLLKAIRFFTVFVNILPLGSGS